MQKVKDVLMMFVAAAWLLIVLYIATGWGWKFDPILWIVEMLT